MSLMISGIPQETLRKYVRRVEVDEGRREGLSSEEREEIKKLRRENFELRRANEILKAASRVFREGARPTPTEVTAFIEEHRGRFGVEPICRTLDVSASAYYERASGRRSERAARGRAAARAGSASCTSSNF